jgi:ADP-heptose:LPS heptosyltransferase
MEQSMRAKKWLDRGVYLASVVLSGLINFNKDPKKLSFKKIICIKEDEIGDFIYTLPVYETLRRLYPDAEITVLCRPFGQQILKNSQSINKVISSYHETEKRYDLVVDLRGTIPSTWLGLRCFPAYRLDRGSIRFRNKKSGTHPHESEANRQIIAPLLEDDKPLPLPRIDIGAEDREAAIGFLKDNGVHGPFALFHTGARRVLKKWPLDRVAEIMRFVSKQYGYSCVLVGDKADAADAQLLQQLTNVPVNVAAGKVPLMVFAALCESAALYLGNDSGPLHIACAMGTPSIGLYGPGDPIFHPRCANARYIHHILECNPCDQVHCKYRENPCIQRISISEVQGVIDALMTQKNR